MITGLSGGAGAPRADDPGSARTAFLLTFAATFVTITVMGALARAFSAPVSIPVAAK